MGLLSGILGNASKVDTAELQEELGPLLIDGEDVVTAFKVVRDLIVFTNLRVIFIDKQGITGRKVDYMTVPYGSIVQFSKEGRGVFDLDAELKIWIRGQAEPIEKKFRKDEGVNEAYRVLSQAVLT